MYSKSTELQDVVLGDHLYYTGHHQLSNVTKSMLVVYTCSISNTLWCWGEKKKKKKKKITMRLQAFLNIGPQSNTLILYVKCLLGQPVKFTDTCVPYSNDIIYSRSCVRTQDRITLLSRCHSQTHD